LISQFFDGIGIHERGEERFESGGGDTQPGHPAKEPVAAGDGGGSVAHQGSNGPQSFGDQHVTGRRSLSRLQLVEPNGLSRARACKCFGNNALPSTALPDCPRFPDASQFAIDTVQVHMWRLKLLQCIRAYVEHSAPGLGSLPAHALDRQQHLLPVGAHADGDEQRYRRGLAVNSPGGRAIWEPMAQA